MKNLILLKKKKNILWEKGTTPSAIYKPNP